MNFADVVKRVQVVLTATVTWLVAIAALVPLIAGDIADALPEGAAEDVGAWAVRIVVWLTAAIAVIRRVTPVAPSERGLLPPDR